MRNFLKTALNLFVFIAAGVVFQISCSNSDEPNVSLSPNQTGKLVYLRADSAVHEIWTCDYDGSNQTMIPVTLPPDTEFNLTNGTANPHISPDGQKIFATLRSTTTGGNSIYSWNIDGTNMQAVVNPGTMTFLMIGNVN
jgi:Tol biopolymer transport system component